jgi:hypothetical protein
MSTFRNATNSARSAERENARNEQASRHAGALELAPGLKFGIGLPSFLFCVTANVVEIITTIMGYMTSSQKDMRYESIGQLQASAPWLFLACAVIAVGVQIGMHMKAPAMVSVWNRLKHVKKHVIDTTADTKSIRKYLTFQNGFFILCLLLNVVGDGGFITMLTYNPAIVAAWVLLLPYFATLGLYWCWNLMWGDVQDFKDFRAHRKHYYDNMESTYRQQPRPQPAPSQAQPQPQAAASGGNHGLR